MAINQKLNPSVNSAVNIGNLGNTVFNVSYTSIFVIAICNCVLYILLLAYLWPLSIAVDEER